MTSPISGLEDPRLATLLRWLTSITKPVHFPLLISTVFRFAYLSLEMLLFGIAGWGIVRIAEGAPVAPLLAIIVAVAVVKAFSYYFEQFFGHFVAFKALELLRGHAFSKLWPKAPGIVSQSRSGDLLASLTRDVDRIEVVYAHTFAPVVSAIVVPTVALIAVGLSTNGWIVIVPALAYLLSMTLVPFLGATRAFGATNDVLAVRAELVSHLTDSVFGVEEVVGYGRERERLTTTNDLSTKVAKAARRPAFYRAMRRGLNVALMLISFTSIIAVGIATDLSVALIAGLAAGSLRFFEGPRGVEDAVGALDASIASARRIWHVAHAPNAVTNHGTETFPVDSAVTWENVTYRYPNTPLELAPSLDDVTIHAPAGKHTVFVGHSGSGKTTTLHSLLRFDDPERGQVRIGGVPVREIDLNELRGSVALVMQKTQILDTTIADNLRLGNPEATDEQIWHALEVAELADEVREMRDGLETRTGQDGTKLSGGQAQRLGLARALLTRPKIILFDEFTANLDSKLARKIRRNLSRELDGVTTIEVTHRPEEVEGADVVYRFDAGKASFPTNAVTLN